MVKQVKNVFLIGLAFFGAGLGGCANSEKATQAAEVWIGQQKRFLGPEAKALVMSCQDTDSDRNGYCSCDVVVQVRPDLPPTYPNLECACGWLQVFTEGCKQKGMR